MGAGWLSLSDPEYHLEKAVFVFFVQAKFSKIQKYVFQLLVLNINTKFFFCKNFKISHLSHFLSLASAFFYVHFSVVVSQKRKHKFSEKNYRESFVFFFIKVDSVISGIFDN